jgi:hypothetical protein
MTEGTSLALLLEASKIYGPISMVLVAVLVLLFFYLKRQQEHQAQKTEADRAEHMEKWKSMVSGNAESMQALAQSHRDSVDAVIKNNGENLSRMFRLYERQAEASEAMAHSMAQITHKLSTHKVCPIAEESHGKS